MNKLAQAREALGIPQGALAEAIGVSKRTIAAHEAVEDPTKAYVMAAQYISLKDELRALCMIALKEELSGLAVTLCIVDLLKQNERKEGERVR